LTDCHCHLQASSLWTQLPALLAAARQQGISRWVCCATHPDDWDAVTECARHYPGVIPFFGIHPLYLEQVPKDWLERLESLLLAYPQSGVGEIGLDSAALDRRALQREIFVAQLGLARKHSRPVNIHCRRAWDEMPKILAAWAGPQTAFILHSFSGSAALAPELSKLGAYFSFSGSITRGNNRRGREALLRVPLERLLIETDAPDLPPTQGGRILDPPNVPENLSVVARSMAEILQLSQAELSLALHGNSRRALGAAWI
jgi:TatD DNase family protein